MTAFRGAPIGNAPPQSAHTAEELLRLYNPNTPGHEVTPAAIAYWQMIIDRDGWDRAVEMLLAILPPPPPIISPPPPVIITPPPNPPPPAGDSDPGGTGGGGGVIHPLPPVVVVDPGPVDPGGDPGTVTIANQAEMVTLPVIGSVSKQTALLFGAIAVLILLKK